MKFSALLRRAARLAAPATVLAAGLAAQNTSDWRTPSSGFVYDSYARSIRPVIGFLGSAHLGAGVASADWASIAPRGASSGAVAAWVVSGGALAFIPDLAKAEAATLGADWPAAQDARWAADGKSAVLSGPASVVVAAIGPDGAPRIERTLPIETGSETRLLGASDDLAAILLATRPAAGSAWQLLLWSKDGAPRQAGTLSEPVAAAFASSAPVAFVADSASKAILRLPLSEDGALEVVLGEAEGIAEPTGLVASADGTRLLVVERGTRTIRGFELASRALTAEIALDEAPDTPLALGSGRYLLNHRKKQQQAFLVLDIAGEPKVVFVPAGE